MSFPLSFMLHQLSVPLLSFGGQFFSRGSGSSSADFLQDFAVIMIVAAIILIITHRLKHNGYWLYTCRYDNWSLYTTI
jgi:hypothetical protein